jgi:hypothetical protein
VKQKKQADRIPEWIQLYSSTSGRDHERKTSSLSGNRLDAYHHTTNNKTSTDNESFPSDYTICTPKIIVVIAAQFCVWIYIISFAVVIGIGFYKCSKSFLPVGITTSVLLGMLGLTSLLCLCTMCWTNCKFIIGSLGVAFLALVIVDSVFTWKQPTTHEHCDFNNEIIVAIIRLSYVIILCFCWFACCGGPCEEINDENY